MIIPKIYLVLLQLCKRAKRALVSLNGNAATLSNVTTQYQMWSAVDKPSQHVISYTGNSALSSLQAYAQVPVKAD